MSISCNIDQNVLDSFTYLDNANLNNKNELGNVFINCENYINVQKEKEIIKVVTHIANICTQALLNSQQKGIERFSVTVNFKNLKYREISIKFCKYLAEILKQLFPEKLYEVTLCDPPSFFISSYEIIKKFIDPPTRKKILMMKNNKRINMEEVSL